MDLTGKRILVTGGAGFIGSHLAEHLQSTGNQVIVVDDLSNGHERWVPDGVELIDVDLTNSETVGEVMENTIDLVFHLAARKDPNDDDRRGQFKDNTTMTYNLLEACRSNDIDTFAYASSSTVYGEAPRPTPEDYAPLEPISVYGASKLADEGFVSTYAHSYGLKAYVYRFANVVGSRLRGAVIPDFIEKLQDDPETLMILGDGRQEKSYMHVDDCVDAMCYIIEHADEGSIHTYNLGTRTTTSVDTIARIVADVLNVSPEYEYTGGDRGWTGDVPRMRLSVEKLRGLGWEPSIESRNAVHQAAEELSIER